MTEQISILNIPFNNVTEKFLINNLLSSRISIGERTHIVTANPEIVMHAKENAEYHKAVLNADYIVADGIGIILAAKRLGKPLKERIAGYDLMLSLLDYANQHGLRCFFIGAEERVLQCAVTNIEMTYSSLVVAGSQHGFFDLDDQNVKEKVKQSDADMVFVALGVPKQEKWIYSMLPELDKGLLMGVGGSFDVLAGEVKRAPALWIKFHLEWFYRLLKQPTRWRRVLKIFLFLWLVLWNRNKN